MCLCWVDLLIISIKVCGLLFDLFLKLVSGGKVLFLFSNFVSEFSC